MTTKTPPKTLRLAKSTIRHLTRDALQQVAGGEVALPRQTIDDSFIRRTK